MKWKNTFYLSIFILPLSMAMMVIQGCSDTSNPPPRMNIENQIEVGYLMIDNKRYDEAIEHFWRLLHIQDSETIRLGLASAYGARAGILVENYWDLIIQKINQGHDHRHHRDFHPTPRGTNRAANHIENPFGEALGQLPMSLQLKLSQQSEQYREAYIKFESLRKQYNQIPVLSSPEAVRDVEVARNILSGVENKTGHFYRALFSLILFRYETEKVFGILLAYNQSTELKKPKFICEGGFSQFTRDLTVPLNNFEAFLIDLKIAYNENPESLQRQEDQFRSHRKDILEASQKLQDTICKYYVRNNNESH